VSAAADNSGQPLHLLRESVPDWNAWRAENPSVQISLVGEDLSDLQLSDVNLGGIDLSKAELCGAHLDRANLKMSKLFQTDLSGAQLVNAELYKADLEHAFLSGADLSGAYLAQANLTHADLRGACLDGARLNESSLRGARLNEAVLRSAVLTSADLTGADFRSVDLTDSELRGISYGSPAERRGRFLGIRGLESCHGNALFVRDAKDQDYLDALEMAIDATPGSWSKAGKRLLFGAWGLIDYGRSLGRPFFCAALLSFVFGLIYMFDMCLGWGLIDFSRSAQTPLTPFYFSIVTYSTLGYGDVLPLTWLGELLVMLEVVLGYTTLGLILSILANRVARRA
jgi:uncharacterized protein YjbI with pentapeptide repeats